MKKLYILNLILAVVLLTACVSTTVTADSPEGMSVYAQNDRLSHIEVYTIVDNATGINYIVCSTGTGTSITPRLNTSSLEPYYRTK